MTDRALHSALRDWRQVFAQPVTWAVLTGVAAALAILGPFGTDLRLRPALRFVYWLAMAASTYGAGLLVSLVLWPHLGTRLPRLGVVLVLGVATGCAITPVIVALNLIAFGYWPDRADWPRMAAQYMALALIVTGIIQALAGHLSRADRPAIPPASPPATPALQDRLPVARRGSLLSLSAEDHYTRVRTTAGDTLILIRLSDAMREAAPALGMQVHRSHWVALDGIRDVRRQGDGAIITLRDGAEIPVSRRYMPDIRAAGLLPA